MTLHSKIFNPTSPVIFYEVIPPKLNDEQELEDRLELVRNLADRVDVINIPEIREEKRGGQPAVPVPERMEPREFARAIASAIASGCPMETAVNRVTVHQPAEDQAGWLRESFHDYHIRNLILVGGESAGQRYLGPGVAETADMVRKEGLPFLLGGICIPGRKDEVSRVLEKYRHGLRVFTTQVLLDPLPVVELLRALNGMEARILLSFTPTCHPRDLVFLERLGVEVPGHFSETLRTAPDRGAAVDLSIALAKRILEEVFENLPPRPPAIGLQVERITKRNSEHSLRMLDELGSFYPRLLRDCFAGAPLPSPPHESRD